MRRKRTFWLDAYRETLEERKQGPDFKLIECLDIMPKGPVLDLGMGKGRHAIFFAKLGREVEGVDTSKLSKGIPEIVEADGLNFTYHKMDLRDFEIPKGRYALIIASRIIQLFQKSDIENLAHQIQAGLKPGGVLYIYTFSTEHIQYIGKWDGLEKVEENTFYYSKYNLHFHVFSKEELLGLFPKLRIQYYVQGLTFNRRVSRLSGVIQYVGKKLR